METKKKVGIVANSNAQKEEYREQNEALVDYLESIGLEVEQSSCLYEKNSVFSGTPKERADQLMRFFLDPNMEEIYDISGGDVANQILNELDYEAIAKSRAVFWGYSDLTTVINAIYTMTGKASVLYYVKHLVVGNSAAMQQSCFKNRTDLFRPSFRLVQQDAMRGVVVGGNIRCFLKLAGTRYYPNLNHKVLLLEAHGGEVAQMATYLAQLKQLGAFDKVNGIILGTFTAMEKNHCVPDMLTLVREYAHPEMPIAVTREIGHGEDAKAIFVGREIVIENIVEQRCFTGK